MADTADDFIEMYENKEIEPYHTVVLSGKLGGIISFLMIGLWLRFAPDPYSLTLAMIILGPCYGYAMVKWAKAVYESRDLYMSLLAFYLGSLALMFIAQQAYLPAAFVMVPYVTAIAWRKELKNKLCQTDTEQTL